MIVNFIFIIGALILNLIHSLLSGLNFLIPTQISTSLTTLFSYLKYFEGVFPVYELLAVLGFLFSFSAIWYTIKLLLWAWHLIPWVGKKTAINSPTKSV